MNLAVFLDRDGVITRDPPHFAHRIDQLEIIPNSAEAIRILNENGFKVVVVSNQSGVARGYYLERDIGVFNQAMEKELKNKGAFIDAIYYCPHHPKGKIEKYRIDCDCRKPKPGMFKRAEKDLNLDLKQSFMVGDKLTDVGAGYNAGCKPILVLTGHGKDEFKKVDKMSIKPNYVSKDLYDSIKIITNRGDY